LLEMPLRFYHLPGMHAGKFLGNVVQRYNLAVPRLRGAQWFGESIGDLCKTPLFAQSLRQAQILILKILNVFLWLKFSPSLALNKNERFSKVSIGQPMKKIKGAAALFIYIPRISAISFRLCI